MTRPAVPRLEVLVDSYSPLELRQRSFVPFVEGVRASSAQREPERHPLVEASFDWPDAIYPRWTGEDTSRCVAGITTRTSPSAELNRLRQGARVRDETSIVFVELAEERGSWPRLSGPSENVLRLPSNDQVVRQMLPRGVSAELARDLEGADRDLALRIRQTHDTAAPWFVLTLDAASGGDGAEVGEPSTGSLRPLLVDDVGEAIAAVWVPESNDERWYLLPIGCSWESILAWLVDQGFPSTFLRQLPASDP
jgi:hypothetical protein